MCYVFLSVFESMLNEIMGKKERRANPSRVFSKYLITRHLKCTNIWNIEYRLLTAFIIGNIVSLSQNNVLRSVCEEDRRFLLTLNVGDARQHTHAATNVSQLTERRFKPCHYSMCISMRKQL